MAVAVVGDVKVMVMGPSLPVPVGALSAQEMHRPPVVGSRPFGNA